MFGVLEIGEFWKSIKNTTDCFWEVIKTNWLIWPAGNLINFFLIPIHFRVLFSNIIGFLWTIFITWKAHRDKELFKPEKD